MSLAIDYENVHDAQMRLQGTVVLYAGEPVYITEVGAVGPGDPKGDVFRVYASPIPMKPHDMDKGKMRKFISSKKFDLAPFPMGFMNYKGSAYYCSRLPRRQQRQGLSNGTFQAMPVGNRGLPVLRLEDVIYQEDFYNCIKGKYPPFDEACKRIALGAEASVAFHRSFALIRDEELSELVYLYHKKDKVGFLLGDMLKLSKAGKCLVEVLKEANVRC
jgi:hypothetical protein